MPEFQGEYKCSGNELIDLYKFDLYDENEELLESSDWQQHNLTLDSGLVELGYANALDTHIFTTLLEDNKTYKIKYSVKTENLFEISSDFYEFVVNASIDTTLNNLEIHVASSLLDADWETTEGENDDGAIYIYIKSKDGASVNGSYVLLRSSEYSSFKNWEDIKFFTLNDDSNKKLAYKDFTVESGVRYKYAISSVNYYGLRSTPL
jgi:hypothetical protein